MAGSKPHITVLGAGLAGLSCAWELSRRGFPVQVIEREHDVGGMARTIKRGDYIFDIGPHRFYTRDQQVLSLVQNTVGEELLTNKRISHVHLFGRYLDYPPNVANLLKYMNPGTSMRCLFDYFKATWGQRGHRAEEPDFQSWVVNRFGQHLYDIYFGPYTQKVWGESPQNLSSDLAKRRITVPNLSDVLLRLMFSNYGDQGVYVDNFWYPEGGIGRISEQLADEIIANNGEILLGCKVEKIFLENDLVAGLGVNDGNASHFLPCSEVLSTIPLPVLIRILDPNDPSLRQHVENINYRALIFVFLMLDRPQLAKAHWIYFPEQDFIINRVSEPSMCSPTHAPPGKTSLCVEITCQVGDQQWILPEEELNDKVIHDLIRAGLIKSSQVESLFTYRFPWGYPIYTLDYREHLDALLAYIDQIDNLITFGRQGGFDYSSISESIASGLKTAALVSSKPFKETDEYIFLDLARTIVD
jgi:protoporphyrinogen oxidase